MKSLVLLIISFVAVGAFIAPTSETAMLDVGEKVQLDAACSEDELAAGKTEDEPEGSMVCVACADSSDKTFNDVGTCVASCPSGKTANALRECTCPDGTAIKSVNDTSCVDCNESADFQYTNGGVCVASCPADKPPNSIHLCSCPDGKAVKSDTDSRCVPCVESTENLQTPKRSACVLQTHHTITIISVSTNVQRTSHLTTTTTRSAPKKMC